MDAATEQSTISDTSLALHFNAFTGRLEGGYLYSHRTKRTLPGSRLMTAAEAIAYLTEHPDVRCAPMKV